MQDKVFRIKTSLNIRGKLLDISSPIVMGILNITPDSFYDGGKFTSDSAILSQTEKILSEGATIVDIGAYSSKPGADHVSEEEELERLTPTLKAITKEFPKAILSIDTFRASIAKKAIDMGAAIINDISGGKMDSSMFETIAKLNVPYILMHIQGTPQTMQLNPTYKNIIEEVIHELAEKVNRLHLMGVNDIVIDPGLGFGKSLTDNYQLIQKIPRFHTLGLPILIGASRKSMLYKVLECEPKDALHGTTALNTIALLNGANILRVHDVKAATDTIKIVNQYKNS